MSDLPIFQYDTQPDPIIPWTPIVGMEGFIEHEDGSRTPFTVGEVTQSGHRVVLMPRLCSTDADVVATS